jgi:hypothetical protein
MMTATGFVMTGSDAAEELQKAALPHVEQQEQKHVQIGAHGVPVYLQRKLAMGLMMIVMGHAMKVLRAVQEEPAHAL